MSDKWNLMMQAAESEWLAERCNRGPIRECKAVLEQCINRIDTEQVKMPLNVACSDVLRGVIKRSGEYIIVTGHAHFHRHQFEFQNVEVSLPQIALLRAALARSLGELTSLCDGSDAHSVLNSARAALTALTVGRKQLAVPERGFRFPQKFFELGNQVPAGFCGEMFACEEHNLVFKLHAYQDRGSTYVATDSVSVKGTDPQLHEMWQVLDKSVVRQLDQVIKQIEAVLLVER